MNTRFNYYCYENAIPHHICDKIISLIKSSKTKLGIVGGEKNKDSRVVNKKVRKSHVAFDSAWWIYRWTHPFIYKSNKDAGWNFEWDHSEPFQLTEYRPGEFYKWHTDQFHIPFGEKDPFYMRGKIRKLSSVVALNDGDDYEGGDLEFYKHNFNGKDPASMRKKGSMVVFPSFVWHRVNPVKKGIRLSLTNWHLGQPFK